MIRGAGQGLTAVRREQVLVEIRLQGTATPKAIREVTGLSEGYVSDILAQLLSQGRIRRVRGGYQAAEVCGHGLVSRNA